VKRLKDKHEISTQRIVIKNDALCRWDLFQGQGYFPYCGLNKRNKEKDFEATERQKCVELYVQCWKWLWIAELAGQSVAKSALEKTESCRYGDRMVSDAPTGTMKGAVQLMVFISNICTNYIAMFYVYLIVRQKLKEP
jgi:hypothetical protein